MWNIVIIIIIIIITDITTPDPPSASYITHLIQTSSLPSLTFLLIKLYSPSTPSCHISMFLSYNGQSSLDSPCFIELACSALPSSTFAVLEADPLTR